MVALPGEDDFDVYEVQLDDTMAIEEYSPDQLRAAAEEPLGGRDRRLSSRKKFVNEVLATRIAPGSRSKTVEESAGAEEGEPDC